jgi:glycosyltransferase involved in cell wall biosynthesis
MRVAVIGTEAGGGGAGRALYRSVLALTQRGHEVDVLHIDQRRVTPQSILVQRASSDTGDGAQHAQLENLERAYLGPRRSALSDTLFSHDIRGYDLSALEFLAGYDVINIHWSSFFLSVEGIGGIVKLGRPVVFTLHDMVYFTGGCHYSAGCRNYIAECSNCPQINPDTLQLALQAQEQKRALFNRPNVAVTAPSQWLTRCAASSTVFAGRPCRHISNPIETEIFQPLDRTAARAELGLDEADQAILFGAFHGRERRKGFRHLVAAVHALRQDARVAGAFAQGRIKVLTFGAPPDELAQADLPIISLGFIDDDAALARIYTAADVLVLPSIEDNQPNVMIEAMACGLPVVAFNVGGIPDWVSDGETGFMAPPYDVRAMARLVGDILVDDALAAGLRQRAAAKVRQQCSFEAVGAQLEAAFDDLIGVVGEAPGHAPVPPAADETGRRIVHASLRYAPRLEHLAAHLPPPPVIEDPAAEPQPEPVEAAFAGFHAARTHLLSQLRAAPEGQLRAAYRVTRTPGDGGRRTGFGALMLNVFAAYQWNWNTLAGALRRAPGYGAAALRSLGRKRKINNAAP